MNTASTLTRSQVKKRSRIIGNTKLVVSIRFDDQCGNGHNSFSLTADIYEKIGNGRWIDVGGGCCHDEIVRFFPDLKKYVKWHLTSTDGPMNYVANTLYHARTCDHDGKKVGDPVAFETFVRFGDFPKRFKFDGKMVKYLKEFSPEVILDSEIIEIEHKKDDGYRFEPKLSLGTYPASEWYQCPFDSMMEVEDFLAMVRLGVSFEEVPTQWAKAVEPNLEYARGSAVWPDATLEQLQDREALEARLPALLEEFKADMKELGFIW